MLKKIGLTKALLSISLLSFGSVSLAGVHRQNDDTVGVASFYSDKFQGQRTASGEPYDKDQLTAAHSNLPFGTVLRVINLRNQRSVVLTVNSRLHRANRRMLDVSKRAAKELGFMQAGLTKVKIEVLEYGIG